jgi:hypothetical protein
MFGSQTQTQEVTNLENTEHTEVRIDALGRVNIEGKNYEGDACSILGDKLRQAFGGGGDKTDKPEAFASTQGTVEQGQQW